MRVLLPFVLAIAVQAQPQFQSGVDVVDLMVSVTDRDGRFVTGLRGDDFAVFEDGRRQQISFFNAERAPVSLGILLDASGSMAASGFNIAPVEYAKASVQRLLLDFLAPEDEFFFAWFGYNAALTQEWTTDRARVRPTLLDIGRPTGDTRMFDAIDFVLPTAQAGKHRKRALLILSDGRDTRSSISLNEVTSRVAATDVLVYALGVEGDTLLTRGDRVDGDVLRRLTDATGGRTEVVRGYGRLDEALAALARELGAQYHIGYVPDRAGQAGFRAVRVETPGRTVRVRTRAGYVR
jgi:Ca-activated chloride channel family protein